MKLRSSRTVRKILVGLTLAAGIGVMAPPSAEACGGGWYPEVLIDYRVQGIARAEKQLEQGKYDDAAAAVIRMIPHIRGYKAKTNDEIINRAMRVLAVSTARTDGKLDIAKQVSREIQGQWLAKEDGDRVANLAWSVQALRAVDTWKSDDPAVQTELGEAMAKLDSTKGEARDLLGKLADKDLLGTAEGYAALAELRGASGDADGRLAALKRCEAMSKTPGTCGSAVLSQS